MSWEAVATSAAPALVAYRWWQRRQRRRRIERELEAAHARHVPVPLHLGPGLAQVAADAGTLRLMLETPIRRIEPPLLHESPWRRRERCDEYDVALGDARRAVWEWVQRVRRLAESDRRLLWEMGLSLDPFRTLLFHSAERTEDVWEQVVYPRAPRLDQIHSDLLETIYELRRFQQALAEVPTNPYRSAQTS